ncbi:MAG: ABC transporter permease [Cyclobacteriaceae bacterium]|nr:ABC transporter permease [Cyclobacteriaceae bacterium]
MLASYLKLALRNFSKNKVPFLINLIGMSIALGCCITAYVNYEYNVDFDKSQVNAPNIYRVAFWQESEGKRTPYGVAPMPVSNLIRQNLSNDEQVIQYISKDAQFRIGDDMFRKQFVYAEPSFTSIFSIELLQGTLSLSDKTKVLISDELAKSYYGAVDVIGKPLTQIISGEPREYEIGGVYKAFPFNSSFRFDLLTSYDNYFSNPEQKSQVENDWSRWATTFVYTKDPATIKSIEAELSKYVQVQNDARRDLQVKSYYVEPFIGMSARAIRERNQGHWMNGPMPPAAVVAPIAMAGFLLLVACFNFMNNSIAVAGHRLKEIGIRKVIGGKRKELIIQFLSETIVFCVLSLMLALVLAEYFTDGWNSMWAGIQLKIRYAENVMLFTVIACLILFTALVAGGYSAFYISSFKPIQILRGTTRFGGAGLLSRSLLVFQFSISLAAVIFALAFYYNSRFQRSYDLGYSYHSVVQVPLENSSQYDLLKNELQQNKNIHSIGGATHHIYNSSYKAAARSERQVEKEIDVLDVGDDYFETLNVRVIQGRGFKTDQTSDMNEAIVVNEYFMQAFELDAGSLGQRITLNDTTQVYIIGVVKDVYLKALFQPLSAMAFRNVPKSNYQYLVASTDPENLVSTNQQIKESWQKLFPNQLYTGKLMEQNMMMVMEHFDSVVILYTFLGAVAIIMSISGLCSLVSLNLQKRNKEFGIRKIMGAPTRHMVMQASKAFWIIMMISFVIGSAMGSIMVNGLMDSVWEYYVAINVEVLTLAVAILLTIAVATVGYKVFRVVATNPVDSLRYE